MLEPRHREAEYAFGGRAVHIVLAHIIRSILPFFPP
jgi:hypothetical protein